MTDQVNEAVAWPRGVLNRDRTLEVLTQHNAWRRGAEGEQTDPRILGLALDAAIAAISGGYTHPARGVVDEDAVNRALDAWFDGDCERPHYDEHIDAMRAALKAAQPAVPSVPEICEWTFDDDEHAPMWTSPCGVAYSFTEGGPEDNGHKFCHSCGKPMLAATPKDQPAQGVDGA